MERKTFEDLEKENTKEIVKEVNKIERMTPELKEKIKKISQNGGKVTLDTNNLSNEEEDKLNEIAKKREEMLNKFDKNLPNLDMFFENKADKVIKGIIETTNKNYERILKELCDKEMEGHENDDVPFVISGQRMNELRKIASAKANGSTSRGDLTSTELASINSDMSLFDKKLDGDRAIKYAEKVKSYQEWFTDESIMEYFEKLEEAMQERLKNPQKYGSNTKLIDKELINSYVAKYLKLRPEVKKDKYGKYYKDINMIKDIKADDKFSNIDSLNNNDLDIWDNEDDNEPIEGLYQSELDKNDTPVISNNNQSVKEMIDENDTFIDDDNEEDTEEEEEKIHLEYFQEVFDNDNIPSPSQMSGVDNFEKLKLLSNRFGRRFQCYLPNSNYVAIFNETTDSTHLSTITESYKMSGEISDISVFRNIYETMEFKVNGPVSFSDFLKYTSAKDIPYIYMCYARANCPTSPSSDKVEFPVLSVICDECGSITQLKTENPLMLNLEKVFYETYPVEKLREMEESGKIKVDAKLKDLSISFNNKKSIPLYDKNKIIKVTIKDPSIADFISGINKYSKFLFDKTIQRATDEFTDESNMMNSSELLIFKGMNFEKKHNYIQSFNEKDFGTDKAKICEIFKSVQNEYEDILSLIPFIRGIIISPTDSFINSYAKRYNISTKVAFDNLSTKFDFNKLDLFEAIEVLNTLDLNLFKKLLEEANVINNSGDLLDDIKIDFNLVSKHSYKERADKYDDAYIEQQLNKLPEDLSLESIEEYRRDLEESISNIREGKCICGSTKFHISPSNVLFFSQLAKMGVILTQASKN